MRSACALILLAALAASGCSGSGDDEKTSSSAGSAQKIETTKVKVVEDIGRSGGFDPGAIYQRLSPGVVTIVSLLPGQGGLLGRRGGEEAGQGSGFVIDAQGHIATNAHVVTSGLGSKLKRAKEVFIQFGDGNQVPAKILGADPNADVALLQIDPKGLDLTPLALGSSEGLHVGEPVAALGSPFGEEQSLSVGVVSALDRDIESLTAFRIGNAIQTDAAINPGNSGGPLLDARGRVIGINSQIRSRSGGGEGVGFAVPVDTVRRSLDSLRAKGRVDYAFLGVTSQPLYPQLARKLGIDAGEGALVVQIEDGSPADRSGLKVGEDKIEFQGQEDVPKGGDAIVAVDGRKLQGANDLSDAIALKKPGEQVKLEVLREGDKREVEVTLAPRPAKAPPPSPQGRP